MYAKKKNRPMDDILAVKKSESFQCLLNNGGQYGFFVKSRLCDTVNDVLDRSAGGKRVDYPTFVAGHNTTAGCITGRVGIVNEKRSQLRQDAIVVQSYRQLCELLLCF